MDQNGLYSFSRRIMSNISGHFFNFGPVVKGETSCERIIALVTFFFFSRIECFVEFW